MTIRKRRDANTITMYGLLMLFTIKFSFSLKIKRDKQYDEDPKTDIYKVC